jgi:hypothetical protein
MKLAVLSSILISAISCQSVRSRLASDDNPFDFCSRSGHHPNDHDRHVWSAATVQTGLGFLVQDSRLKGTAASAYAVSYRRMTEARDQARCGGGALVERSEEMNLLTHELADIMTRWYITETKLCLDGKLSATNGFCGVYHRARDENYDSLSVAMANTAVYLSSHIAWSLSAVAFHDEFWDRFPDPATHHIRGPLEPALEARKKWLKEFKPTYDRFNEFLGGSLDVVAKALEDADLLRDHVLLASTHLSKILPCKAKFFSGIRDKSFTAALDIIDQNRPDFHPMLRRDRNRYSLNYSAFNPPEGRSLAPESVLASEDFALWALASPPARLAYRELLGGKADSTPKCNTP